MKYGSDYRLKNKRNTKDYKSYNKRNIKKKNNKKAMRIVIIILLLIIIGAGATFGYKIYQNGGGLFGTLATILGEDKESLENLEPIQVLIMGESGVDDYKLADTIMIASYNPKTQQASLMSIPRDTYVGARNKNTATQNYLASYKINSVYRNGTNIPEAIERINDVTGLNLENYVIIDTNALIKLVDAIGGVYFNVPMDMDYDDTSQDLHIHLKAGEQLIDGPKAEQLLRFRHNNDGSTYPTSYGQQDLGRMRTQREFITATLKQTLKLENIFKLKQIIDIMAENVKTNMQITELKSYVPYAVEFDANNLKTGVLPGEPEMCNGVSIYVADEDETEDLVNELFLSDNIEEEVSSEESNTTSQNTTSDNSSQSKNVKVEVLNGSGSTSTLKEVVNKLKEAGYTVTKQGTTNSTARTTITNRTNQSSEITSEIEKILGVGNVTTGSKNSSVDISIVIGTDY